MFSPDYQSLQVLSRRRVRRSRVRKACAVYGLVGKQIREIPPAGLKTSRAPRYTLGS